MRLLAAMNALLFQHLSWNTQQKLHQHLPFTSKVMWMVEVQNAAMSKLEQ